MASAQAQYTSRSHTISVGARSFQCAAGISVLDALAGQEMFLPSACGGRGSCATCKCTILSPNIAHSLKEIPYLSSQERDANVHLACQVHVNRSMEIDVPFNVLHARAYSARITKIETFAESSMFVHLTLEEGGIEFIAGQFVLVEAIDDAGLVFRRAYSLVHSPQSPSSPVLLVGCKQGGRMSNFFRGASTKIVRLIGPFGEFLPFRQARSELWLAANSGIAPFLSMLADDALWGDHAPRRTLIYRNSSDAETLVLQKFVMSLRSQNTLQVFFDDGPPEKRGLPTRLANFLSQTSELPDCVLICSSPSEADSCTNILITAGIDPRSIRRDTF